MKLLKNLKKANNGITLIALVITIIVLLILAGVSIAMLTGENGILTQAQNSRTKTEMAQLEEEIKLAYASIKTDSYLKGWDINKKAEEIQKELRENDPSATVTVNGTNFEVSYKGYETTLSEKGKVGELIKAKIAIKKFEVSGIEVKEITPPTGFVHVGGTINEGYVISDNPADENKGVDSTELLGNQFVWVPVEKAQKVRINVSSEEEITNIVITDPYGDELLNESNVGKSYSNEEIEPTINGCYNLEVTTASGTKERMIDVYSLYAIRMWEPDMCASDEYAKLNGYNNVLELIQDRLPEYGIQSIEQGIELLRTMYKSGIYAETEEIDHVAKVEANGGFYIGRYEATYEDGKVASKKATVNSRTSSSTSLENGMLWNYINQEDSLEKAKEYNTSLSSTLPTGAAWDRVIGWLYETGEKTKSELTINSTSWGNYYNDEFSNTTGLIKPGEFEETKANNIYDLAGNVWEWTTEAYVATCRVRRGGNYLNFGFNFPASGRNDGDPSGSDYRIGLRLTLFL